VVAPPLSFQPSLFAAAPAVDVSFATVERVHLDDESWVDVVRGWLCGTDEVFAALAARATWKQRDRLMWGTRVPEPRLTAGWGEIRAGAVAPVLGEARRALSQRYGVVFDSGWLNLYRDGRDSVAWHRDKIDRRLAAPLVGILSLGATRRFLVRPYGGGPSRRFDPAAGDLLVTGGLMQRQWEHAVPKTRDAGPRISVTFRHSA
jgi:alkylated DNA repair dioxygenase AlkB